MSARISVCFVTYRRDADLLHSIAKLLESDFQDFELLVVDNGCSPVLRNMMERAHIRQPWKLVQATANRGCASLNLLFPLAQGEIVACFDDDSYPHPECLGRALEAFRENKSLGMIGFKMHVPETGEPWHDELWNPDVEQLQDTAYCSGCGLAFRRDARLPEELCLPSILSQQHELSMAAEVLRLGYKVQFRPECKAYHPQTGGDSFPQAKFEMLKRNQMIFLGAYLPAESRRIVVLSYLLFIFRHRQWKAADHLRAFLREPKRTLSRAEARAFHETALLHTHRRLKKRMARSLGVEERMSLSTS